MSQDSATCVVGREALYELLDDLERAERFSLVGGLKVLTRATIGIDERLEVIETKVDNGFAAVHRKFEAVDRRFDAVDREIATMRHDISTMGQDIATIRTEMGLISDDVRKMGASIERLTGYIIRDEMKGRPQV